jgi:hypothetical protein
VSGVLQAHRTATKPHSGLCAATGLSASIPCTAAGFSKCFYYNVSRRQIAIDDRLISKARTVTNLGTDKKILEETLRGYIVNNAKSG